MAISVTALGGYEDITDRTSYTTGDSGGTGTTTYNITNGRRTYIYVEASKAAGDGAPPTVTCSNGDTLTMIGPYAPEQWGTAANKSYVFAFWPTSGSASATFTFNFAGVTMTQLCINVWDMTEGNPADGVNGLLIPDSGRFVQTFPNATSVSIPVQAAWNAANVVVGCFFAGSGGLTTSAGAGSPTKIQDAGTVSGAATLGTYYKIGGADALGMTWTGSFSNGGIMFEVPADGTTRPPTSLRIVGTPISDTAGGTTMTYASFTPAAYTKLLMIWAQASTAGNLRNEPVFTGTLGLPWRRVGPIQDSDTAGTPTQRLMAFETDVGPTPPTGTVILTWTGSNTGNHLIILQGSADAIGRAIVQAFSTAQDATSTPSVSLPKGFSHPGNGTLGVFLYDPPGAGDTLPGSGFEEVYEGSFGTPSSELFIQWRHTNDGTADATLPASGDVGSMIFEFGQVALDPVVSQPVPMPLQILGPPVFAPLRSNGQAVSSSTDLVIQDATHSHAADNVVLTQGHILVVQDALHAHAADNLTLTQTHVLQIQDALHAHAADNVVLAVGGTTLVIQDAVHVLSSDVVVFQGARVVSKEGPLAGGAPAGAVKVVSKVGP